MKNICSPLGDSSKDHMPASFTHMHACVHPGETYDQYRTALRKIADGCEFDTITPNQFEGLGESIAS